MKVQVEWGEDDKAVRTALWLWVLRKLHLVESKREEGRDP